MSQQLSIHDARILELVGREKALLLDRVVALLPDLTWNQVFHCVDRLSRRGELVLRRRGPAYEVLTTTAVAPESP